MDLAQFSTIIGVILAFLALLTTLIIQSINKIDTDIKSISTRLDSVTTRLDGHAARIDQLYSMFISLLKEKKE